MDKMDMKLIRTNPVRSSMAQTNETIGSINDKVCGATIICTYKFGGEVLKQKTFRLQKKSNIGINTDCPVHNCDGSNYIFTNIIEDAIKRGCISKKNILCNGNTDPISHHPTAKCQGNVDIEIIPIFEEIAQQK